MEKKKTNSRKTTSKIDTTKKVVNSVEKNDNLKKIIAAIVVIALLLIALISFKACSKQEERSKKDKEVIKKEEVVEDITEPEEISSYIPTEVGNVVENKTTIPTNAVVNVVENKTTTSTNAEVSQPVEKKNLVISIKLPGNLVADGTEKAVEIIFKDENGNEVEMTNYTIVYTDEDGTKLAGAPTVRGTYTVTVIFEGNDEYKANSATATFKIVNEIATSDTTTIAAALASAKDGDTIIISNDIAEDVTITADKNVILDLNGKTLTGKIVVKGDLTVKDEIGTGSIEMPVLMNVDGGTFTLESGIINSANGYGVYCLNDAKAIINGGEINSKHAALAGNNTTGAMSFEVHGGKLTAQDGPAIYMPGPVDLNITGGELNGGISLRMGIVNISGGTINAITSNIDSIADYYDYSGNAWLADALYVFGGTYTTDAEGATNKLELNITGGTFNCANGQGSAVAIYDLGKVEQEMKVNISSDATLTTNSTTRNEFDIIGLSDFLDATKLAEAQSKGYGKAEYVEKVTGTVFGNGI